MATLPSVAILAHRRDLAAMALATALHRRGRCRVVLCDEYDLVRARVVHRPNDGLGDVVELSGGIRISAEIDVLLCRIAALPSATQSDPDRQAYADAEMFALAVSWLAGLGDAVVNRPSPLGLAGLEPDLVRLHRLAAEVRLAVPRLRLTSNGARCPTDPALRPLHWPAVGLPRWYAPVQYAAAGPPLPRPTAAGEPVRPLGPALVAGDEVVGAPPELHDRLVALARVAGLAVCEVGLGWVDSAAEPVVTGLSAVPGLTGPGQLAALADYLERRGENRGTGRSAA